VGKLSGMICRGLILTNMDKRDIENYYG
jgi:hypothetical protein